MMNNKIRYLIVVLLLSLMITGTALGIPLKDDNQLNLPKLIPSTSSDTNYPVDVVEVSKIIGTSISSQYSRNYVAYSWDGVTTADTTWTGGDDTSYNLSLIHISEPTRLGMISYAVFCLKKKKKIYTNL